MKTWKGIGASVVVVIFSVGVALAESRGGSGRLTIIESSETGFTAVSLGSGAKGNVVYSPTYSVVVQVDEDHADQVEIRRRGSTLTIGLRRGWLNWGSRRAELFVDIGMPDLDRVDLSGGSRIVLSGFDLGHVLEIDLSGGSDLRGGVRADSIDFSLSGGSSVALEGEGGSAGIEGSGGSRFDLGGLSLRDVEVNLSGGSRATLRLNGVLSGNLSGGASVRYIGEPTLGRLSTSGGAKVSKM
jgi:hypothetical protein